MKNRTEGDIKKTGLKAWLPVLSLTFSTFIFNTSEFIPIGLLSDIASDFGISESNAGMLITVYAWVVALASLPLMLVFAKTENRKLMLSVTALFTVSHIFSVLSKDFYMLMISRIGVACAHAIFWSIVTPLAVRLAPDGKKQEALSLIVCGSSVAMIVGLPLGRTIGLYLGWRATFLVTAVLAAAILAVLAAVLPKTPSDNSISLRKLPALIKSPVLLNIYLVTLIAITGHFTCYSYIEPFLGQTAGFGSRLITLTLTLFGIVGLIGSYIFARYYDRYRIQFISAAVTGICLFLMLMQAAAFSHAGMLVLCILWGFAINFYNLSFQSEIIRNAPNGTSVAMSIYSGIYNIGIGGGALAGGYVCSGISISHIGYAGGAVALVAAIICFRKLIPAMKKDTVKSVRKDIGDYIYGSIVPEYAAFDPAHREDHARTVIDNSMELYRNAPEDIRRSIDPEMLAVAAACHDLGRINGKERHHLDSGIIIRADRNLRKWFREEQIETIAQAAEDHRASARNEPRSIYGKIVAEADRLIDQDTIIRRTLLYGKASYPDMSSEEQIGRALEHLYEKYGNDGYLRLWIPWSDNARRLARFRSLLADRKAARREVERIWKELQELPLPS